jgi:hypothetical protein
MLKTTDRHKPYLVLESQGDREELSLLCHKQLLVPETISFADIVEQWEPWGDLQQRSPHADEWAVEVPGLTLGSYCQCGHSFKHYSIAIKVKPEIAERILGAMVVFNDDKLYFELVDRGGGVGLLVVKYNQILASRWIAFVDLKAAGLPFEDDPEMLRTLRRNKHAHKVSRDRALARAGEPTQGWENYDGEEELPS